MRATSAERPAIDWNREWRAAWKPHVRNPWFRYQDGVYAGWWKEQEPAAGDGRALRVLQTDAFTEACGLPSSSCDGLRLRRILMDVSPLILRDAARVACSGPLGPPRSATDVRRLGFRSGVFDLVFSPSTLDHFTANEDIEIALRELLRVLRPGGRLLISLDNPANPLLRVRQALYRRTGRLGALIPFAMGTTLSRKTLVATLEDAGFEILDSGYLVHAPRILGLWLGELVARARGRRIGSKLERWFEGLDRLLGALPTRAWTANFVAAHCARPRGLAGARAAG